MQRVEQGRANSIRVAFGSLLLCGAIGWPLPDACADESPMRASQMSDEEPVPVVDPANVKLTPQQKERQRKAYLGLAAVAGIVIVGVALGALTILWAGRLRRQLRRSDPDCAARGGEFWFLKPPKPPVTGSGLPDGHQPSHTPPPTEPS